MKTTVTAAAALALTLTAFTPGLSAGEEGLMHCFAFTEIEDASEEDWDAWFEATDALPEEIGGLEKVWYGKLNRPLRQYNRDGKEAYRQWGVCMLFDDLIALEKYAEHPDHDDWAGLYEKVRVPGTTTFDILGQ